MISRSLPTTAERQLMDLCETIPSLPPYEAAFASRDLVRVESPMVLDRLGPQARRKHEQYLASYFRPARRQRFTDHNYAQKLAPTLERIRRPGVRDVLDAACGNGFEAVLFALHGRAVRANDCAPERCEIAVARRDLYRDLLGAPFRMDVSASNIVEPGPAAERFDLVYVQEAISHIHPAERFLQVAGERYLTQGGRLVICDSNHWNPVTRVRISRSLWRERRTLRHFTTERTDPRTGGRFLMAEERLFSPVGLSRRMRAAGLEVEAIVMSGFGVPGLIGAPDGFGVRLDRAMGRVPGLRLFGGFYVIVARRPAAPKRSEGGRDAHRI